ncbi:MAG: tail fiber domain-containing protein [Patescibacteria group bacterium]
MGDVSIAYDLYLTNTTAGYLKFNGPGYIQTESPSDNLDLTLSAANSGYVVIADTLQMAGDILPDADDTYNLGSDTARFANLWLGADTLHIGTSSADEAWMSYDTTNDRFNLGVGTTGSAPALTVLSGGNVGVGSTNPTQLLSVGSGNQFQVSSTGNVTGGTYNGITITTGTGTLILNDKTLNLSNSLTLAGADGKTINFGTNNLTFSTSGDYTLTIPATGTAALGTGTNGYVAVWNGTNSLTSQQYLNVAQGGTGAGTFSSNYLLKGNGTSAISSSVIYDDGTNVGIGTTAVGTYKLNVAGDINASNYYANGNPISPLTAGTITGQTLYWDGAAWTANTTLFNNNANVGIGTTLPSQLFQVNNSGTSAFVVTSGGNVGIGTTNPGKMLDIVGTFRVKNTLSDNFTVQADSNNAGYSDAYLYGQGTAIGLYANPGISRVGSGSITYPANSSGLISVAGIPLVLGSGGAEKMRITSGGNVGIGTTSPSQLLHIEKNQNATTELLVKNSTNGTGGRTVLFLEGDNSKLAFLERVSPSYTTVPAWAGSGVMGSSDGPWWISAYGATGDIRFQTGGIATSNERMRIDSTGNVGIGTTAPGQALDVNGSIRTNGQLISTLADGTAPFSVTSTTVNTNLNADLLDGHHSSDFQTALTNPVTGTGTENYVAVWGAANSLTSQQYLNVAQGGTGAGTFNTNYLLKGNGTSVLTSSVIYDDGTNVGIGTTAVGTYKLNVAGDINASNYYANGNPISPLTAGTITGQTLYWDGAAWTANTNLFNNNTNVGIGTTLPSQLFQVNNSGTSAFVVTSGGNVGIGTTSPNSQLTVKGSVNVQAVNPILRGSLYDDNFFGAGWVQVIGKYAYMTSNNGSFHPNVSAFSIIDVSDPDNPTLVSQNTDALLDGAEGFKVIGKYAYVASMKANAFVVIDISNPNSPSIVGSITDASLLNGAEDMDISGNYAFVVNANGNSLAAIDISNPASPKIVSSFSDAKLKHPEWVTVKGKYAYVTDDTSSTPYFLILDISNPASIQLAGSLNDASFNTLLGVSISGKYAYVANYGGNKIEVIDISDPTLPSLTSSVAATHPWVIEVAGNYLYHTAVDSGLYVYDLSNPTNPTLAASLVDPVNLNTIDDIFINGKYAYITDIANRKIVIAELPGISTSTLWAGNISADNMDVAGNFTTDKIYANTSLEIGPGGLFSQGLASFANGMRIQGNVGIGSTNPTQPLSIGAGNQFQVSSTGNVTGGTYNGITITTGTGTLTLNDKTLNLSNSLTLSGADGKTINFGTNNLTLSTSGDYTLTIPATGTAALGTGANGYVAVWNGTNSLTSQQYLNVAQGGTGAGTFSSNYLLKGNGTSAIASSVIYDDGANVGIGTTSPGAKLAINGDLLFSSESDSVIRVADKSGGGNNLSIAAGSSIPVGSGGNLNLYGGLGNDSGGKVNISGGMGIGLGGNVYISGGDGIAENGNVILAHTGFGSQGNVGIGTTAPSQLFQVNDSASNPFVITSGGNVGIGTTNPLALLSVGATSQFQVFSAGNVTGGTYNGVTISGNGTLATGAGSYTLTIPATGTAALGTGATNQMAYWNTANTLTGSDNFYFNGTNIGIGTTDVGTYKLNVSGSVHATDYYSNDNTQGASATTGGLTFKNGLYTSGTLASGLPADGTITGQTLYWDGADWTANTALFNDGTNVGIGTTAPAGLFDVNAKFTVLTGGNVGVGTTAPAGLFDVNGKLTVLSGGNVGIGTTAPTHLFQANGSSADYIGYFYNTSTNAAAGGLYIRSDGTGSLLTLNYNGTNILDITPAQTTFSNPVNFAGTGDVSMAYDLYLTNTTAGYLKFNGPGYIQTESPSDNLNLYLSAANAGSVILNDTTKSQDILPLDNDLYNLGSDTARFANLWLGADTLHIGTSSADEAWMSYDTTNDRFNLGVGTTGSAPALTVLSGGNVGVGSTNPTQLLSVGSGNQFQVSSTGNVTGGTYNGITITTGTGTLILNDKTLNLSNSLTLSGADGKTINFGTNNLTFSTSGDYTLTIPATGTAALGTGAQYQMAYWNDANTLTGSDNFYFNGTNIGIGTTDVGTYRLNVNGSINATSYYVGGTALATTTAGSYTGQTNYWNGSAWTASTNLFNDNTIVGIGTTNPEAALEVNGDIFLSQGAARTFKIADRFTSGSGYDLTVAAGSAGLISNNAGGTLILQGGLSSGFGNGGGVNIVGTASGDYATGGPINILAGDNGSEGTGGAINLTSGSAHGAGSFGGNIAITTGDGGSSMGGQGGDLIINLGTGSTRSGRVGIGTTAPSQLFQVNNSGSTAFVVTSGGNVGIGTTSPGAALDIYGKFKITNDGMAAWGTAADQGLLSWGTGKVIVGSAWGYDLVFSTNGVGGERMLIDKIGNVGIGTTAPEAKLHLSVDGTTLNSDLYTGSEAFISSSNGNSNFRMVAGGNATVANSFVMLKTRGTVESPSIVSSGDVLGNIYGQGYDGASRIAAAVISFTVDGTPGSNDMPGRITFSTTPDGSSTLTERLRITSGGNVGIGSTNPTQLLSVGSGNQFQVSSTGNVTGGTYNGITITTGTGTLILNDKTLNLSNSLTLSGADGKTINFGTNNLTFSTSGDYTLTIPATGTAALGTGTNGYVAVWNGTNSLTSQQYLNVAQGGTGAGTFSSNYLLKGNGASALSSSVIYDDGTNVGIGTTAVGTYKLNVAGDINATNYYANGNPISPLTAGTITGQTLYWNGADWTANTNLFNDGTNVGIGTTSPAGQFDVNGKLTVLSGGNVGIGTTAPAGLFDVNAKFTVLFSGNVGIGTTNSLAKLTVFGTDNALRLAYDDANYSTLSVDASGNLSMLSSNTAESSVILGSGAAQDTSMIFDGSSQDFYAGLDDTDSVFKMGVGQVVGTAAALSITSDGNVGIGAAAPGQKLSVAGSLGIIESTGATYYTVFQGGDQSANVTYTLPTAQGAANYVLRNDGTGVLSWSQIVAASVASNTLDFAQFDNALDLDANLTLNQSTYTWTQNFTGTTTTGLTYNANSLTSGTGMALSSTSTAGLGSNSTKILSIARTGANAIASHTAYGLYSTVANTGTTSTNIAGYFSANGATNNYGLIVNGGNVGIGTTAPTNLLDVAGGVKIGANYAGIGTTAPQNGMLVEGSVGIGTSIPGYKLEVYTGTASGYVDTDGSWNSASDARLKKNISPMESALEKVLALNPVEYNFKTESASDPAHIGFIAQDVEKISPELVSTGPNGMKGLSYAMFTPLLTKAVQEQQAEISNVQIQMSNQIQNLNDQKLQITKQAGDVNELQTAVNDKLTIISQSLALGEANSRTLGERISANEQDITNLKTDLAAAQSKLAESENNLATFEASTTDLLTSMMETENMITAKLLNHEDRIKALEDKLATATITVGEIPANVITQDASGNATLAGIFKAKEVNADGVVAGSYSVKNSSDAPTTGGGKILAVKNDADGDGWDDETKVDGKSAEIETKAVSETAKIFVTFEGDPGARYWVEKTKDADTGEYTGFAVKLSDPSKADANFSWWIVESR